MGLENGNNQEQEQQTPEQIAEQEAEQTGEVLAGSEDKEVNENVGKEAKNRAEDLKKAGDVNSSIEKKEVSIDAMAGYMNDIANLIESKGAQVAGNLGNVVKENQDLLNLPQNIVDAIDGYPSSIENQNIVGKFFFEKGYFFNGSIDSFGGDILIKIDGERKLDGNSGCGKLFGEEALEGESYYIINDPDFQLSGNSFGGVAVLNVPRNQGNDKIDHNSDFAKSTTKEDFGESMANNEVTHEILKNKYDFTNNTVHDWSGTNSGVEGYNIPNSQQVHEFMSDVGSTSTSVADFSRMLGNAITSSTLSIEDGDLKLSGFNKYNPQYEYSNRFLYENVSKIFEEKGIKTQQFTKGVELTTDISNNMLAALDNTDLSRLQSAYLNQGKLLLNEIKSIKK